MRFFAICVWFLQVCNIPHSAETPKFSVYESFHDETQFKLFIKHEINFIFGFLLFAVTNDFSSNIVRQIVTSRIQNIRVKPIVW